MKRVELGDAVTFHGVNESVVTGTVTGMAWEEGYLTITVRDADAMEHCIASGGHFGDSFAIEGYEEAFLQEVTR